MNYFEIKKHLKKITKQFLKNFASHCKNCKLSKKSIGIIIRTFHMSLPISFIYILLYFEKTYCLIVIFFLFVISFMYYVLDGCFLSILENELCKDNFTAIDPILELLNKKINNKNRILVSNVSGFIYIILSFFIYYRRFFNKAPESKYYLE